MKLPRVGNWSFNTRDIPVLYVYALVLSMTMRANVSSVLKHAGAYCCVWADCVSYGNANRGDDKRHVHYTYGVR